MSHEVSCAMTKHATHSASLKMTPQATGQVGTWKLPWCVAPSQPAPVVLVNWRGVRVQSLEKFGGKAHCADRGLDYGASGRERGCQAGPSHGVE
jgi:hypothetical protein